LGHIDKYLINNELTLFLCHAVLHGIAGQAPNDGLDVFCVCPKIKAISKIVIRQKGSIHGFTNWCIGDMEGPLRRLRTAITGLFR
jgi:hypothetical protein